MRPRRAHLLAGAAVAIALLPLHASAFSCTGVSLPPSTATAAPLIALATVTGERTTDVPGDVFGPGYTIATHVTLRVDTLLRGTAPASLELDTVGWFTWGLRAPAGVRTSELPDGSRVIVWSHNLGAELLPGRCVLGGSCAFHIGQGCIGCSPAPTDELSGGCPNTCLLPVPAATECDGGYAPAADPPGILVFLRSYGLLLLLLPAIAAAAALTRYAVHGSKRALPLAVLLGAAAAAGAVALPLLPVIPASI